MEQLGKQFKEYLDAKYIEQEKKHLYRKIREIGASSLEGCLKLALLKELHVKLPEPNLVQKNKTHLNFGNELHEWVQRNVKLHIKPEVGIWVEELYVKVKIGEYTVRSPIDLALVHTARENGEAYSIVSEKFGDYEEEINTINKNTEFLKIVDIKGLKSYEVNKLIEGKPFSIDYQFQFHVYMAAAKLTILEVLVIEKETGDIHSFNYEWNNAIWEKLVARMKERRALWRRMKDYLPEDKAELTLDDLEGFTYQEHELGCLKREGIPFWGCPLAQFTLISDRNSPHRYTQKVIQFCKDTIPFLIERARKFQIGEIYKRFDAASPGSFPLQVKILEIKEEKITVVKLYYRKETEVKFTDSFLYAGTHYAEIKKEGDETDG